MRMVMVLGLSLSWLLFAPCSDSGEVRKIGALGKIDPKGGIISLTGPIGERIASICVKESDLVKKDTPLVIFQSNAILQQEVALAEIADREADEAGARAIALQELKLRQAEATGAESLAQREFKLKSAKEEQELAARQFQRFQKIGGESLSAHLLDERQTAAKVAQIKVNSVADELKSVLTSNKMSADIAGAELNRLKLNRELNMKQAAEQLELVSEKLKQSVLRAPSDGTILEILMNPGETSGARPIIRMGDLENMYVVAEVFDRDLLQVKPGMKVDVTGNSLPEPLTGEVESIGRVITLPARTALVKIRLDDVRPASRLINVEVNVSIRLQ